MDSLLSKVYAKLVNSVILGCFTVWFVCFEDPAPQLLSTPLNYLYTFSLHDCLFLPQPLPPPSVTHSAPSYQLSRCLLIARVFPSFPSFLSCGTSEQAAEQDAFCKGQSGLCLRLFDFENLPDSMPSEIPLSLLSLGHTAVTPNTAACENLLSPGICFLF